MGKLFENLGKSIENWLLHLQDSYGISPGTTLLLAVILLVLLIFIISNGSKHKKLKKMAEQNQAAAMYLKENMDEVLGGMDSIEGTLINFGEKLGAIEKKKKESAPSQNPSIIYIDNRQGTSCEKANEEEILENINRVSNQKTEDPGKDFEEKNDNFIGEDYAPGYGTNQLFDIKETMPEFTPKETEPRAIYTDRLSGVSKSGKEYTLEQLRKQIKD